MEVAMRAPSQGGGGVNSPSDAPLISYQQY